MSIALTGTGGLATRIGKQYVALTTLNTARGATLDTLVANIVAQYASTHQEVVANIYPARDAFRTVFASFLTELQTEGVSTIVKMTNDNTPLASLTLQPGMRALVAYMQANSASVKANAVSQSVAAGGSNVGTAVCLASVKGFGGSIREYLLAEAVTLRASTSAQDGSTTAGSETWLMTSPVPESDQLSWDWPLGSGVSSSVTSCEPSGSLNLLTNGTFETFTTPNSPTNWTINAGVVGTNIFETLGTVTSASNASPIVITTSVNHGLITGQSVTIAGNSAANGTWTITKTGATTFTLDTSVAAGLVTGGTWTSSEQFRGSNCLKLTGTGGGVASIQQLFNNATTGNGTLLLPLTVYAIHCWLKVSAVPAAGVLEISLVDGSGSIVSDYAGSNTGNVSGASNTTPIVITTQYAHRIEVGETVTIASVGGNTNANARWRVSAATDTTLTLEGSAGNSNYTTGGTWTQNKNVLIKTLSAATTSYTSLGTFFRTPATMPSACSLRVRHSTDITSGKSSYVDDLCLALATQVYPQGPFVSIFPGATNIVVADTQVVTVANDWGGLAQKAFQQFFDMRTLLVQLPSVVDGSETIANSLFTP